MTDWFVGIFLGVVGVATMLVIVAIGLAIRDDMASAKKIDDIWRDAHVVKICHDGTYIYHLKDGRYVTGGLGATIIDDPATVCQ